jgi:hypothetical protein
MYRQGDIMLVEVSALPERATPVPAHNGRVILAEGEATGHAHTLGADMATMFEAEGMQFVRIIEPTPLEHQEHAPILIPIGIYRITRQREYSPQAIRRVMD